ncbi:tyrosine-type recombinase/integrase [Haloferax volcanii]|uniref:tyrosine-type recombinase/integrase n=1 Tax=Haloferax volcanii TaxID=2246 RepID=UPI003853BD3F
MKAEEVLKEIIAENPDLVENQGDDLEDVAPEDGVSEYLEHKSLDIRSTTVEEYRNKLEYFLEFCEMRGVEVLSEVTVRQLTQYRHWRRKDSHDRESPLSPKTMRDEMYLLRSFVKFLEDIEAVRTGLHERIDPPVLAEGEGVRDVDISDSRVKKILEYLSNYKYATADHVVWAFHAHTGRRPGGLHSLDLKDLHLEGDNPYLVFRHRPDETSLKNGKQGEREVVIDKDVAEIFRDYIEHYRVDSVSPSGRRPFLTSSKGRLSKSTMRKYIYRWSRPCEIGVGCPHDKNPKSCEAAQSIDQASKCPSSRPPYALRHGYISQMRQQGLRVGTLSARCDVSEAVIEKHYDERTPEQRRKFRRRQLEQLSQDLDEGGYL